jgi:replicative DNA helicase
VDAGDGARVRPAELIIAKQRHGATGKVTLKFEANITRFSDYAGEGFASID